MTAFLKAPMTVACTVTAVALLSACNKAQQSVAPQPAENAPPAVAIVNGAPITRTEYDLYVKNLLQGKAQELTADQKNQVLDDLINTEVIAGQAVKDGIDKDTDAMARLNLLRLRVLADGEIQQYIKSHQPTDSELHAEFDSQVAATDMTEYHARHILVPKDKKDTAVQIIKKLKHGAKFEDLAKTESTDPGSKANGGDLGWFNTSHMVKPFADAVKTLKKGEVTPEPIETQYGWHVIELEDTRPPSFEQTNKQQLINPIMQKKLQAYIESLKKDAKIEKKLDAPAASAAPTAPDASGAPAASVSH
jgi:peptidyl-prolyl cis-trans isomerase C